MYREGYFRQYPPTSYAASGSLTPNDFFNLPLIPETKPTARRAHHVPFPGKEVHARIWRIQIGRVAALSARYNIPPKQP